MVDISRTSKEDIRKRISKEKLQGGERNGGSE